MSEPPEAPLKAPDMTEQQTEQPTPFRLASLTEETPPVVTEATPPVVTEATPPVVTEATPPVVTEATPPVVTEATPPVVTEATPPVVTEATPPVVTEATPPVVTEATPPVVTENTPPVEPAAFPDLGPDLGPRATPDGGIRSAVAQALDIRLLSDIPLEVTVELGRAVLTVSQLLALRPGSVVELTAGASTVDVVVNGRLVARGDVVVVGDSFGVRVTEIVEP